MFDIRVYRLDRTAADLARLETLLDAAETTRAARFRYARDRQRFIARRGLIRLLLAEHLGRDPAAIAFGHGDHGKPFVLDGGDLEFNSSHSGGLGLCVVARGIAIGCDIERRDPDLADPAVAERLFAPDEWRAWRALPPAQWVEGFFNCWTRKEAFIKAIGLGVSHPLDSFDVSVVPGAPARLLRGGEGWSIRALDAAPGYAAALVAAGDAAGRAGTVRAFDPVLQGCPDLG